jgi:hypothetical protein
VSRTSRISRIPRLWHAGTRSVPEPAQGPVWRSRVDNVRPKPLARLGASFHFLFALLFFVGRPTIRIEDSSECTVSNKVFLGCASEGLDAASWTPGLVSALVRRPRICALTLLQSIGLPPCPMSDYHESTCANVTLRRRCACFVCSVRPMADRRV